MNGPFFNRVAQDATFTVITFNRMKNVDAKSVT